MIPNLVQKTDPVEDAEKFLYEGLDLDGHDISDPAKWKAYAENHLHALILIIRNMRGEL